VFELDIDKSKRSWVVRARDIARNSEALVGMIKLVGTIKLKRPAKEVMTRAVMSLDDHHRGCISMHTSDKIAKQKWAEHEAAKVMSVWRYALKLFRKLKFAPASSGGPPTSGAGGPTSDAGRGPPTSGAGSLTQTHLTRVYQAIAEAEAHGGDSDIQVSEFDSDILVSDADAGDMAEWPEYLRNRNDTIELYDESDEEDAAAEEEMFDAAAEVPDTTATPPRPSLPRLPAHLHRRLQSQPFLPQKRLQSKPHSPDDPSGPLPPAASSAPDATVSEETISDCDDISARATWVSSSNREEFEDRMACMKSKPWSPPWRMYAQEHIEAERVHAG
jgi:hypothetical protein